MADTRRIDDLLKAATEGGRVAGLVALAVQDGRRVHEAAVGRKWLPDGPPMTMDTIFWIASMTKSITAVAAMQLVEAGCIDLDEPAGRFVPGLAAPEILLGFDGGGQPLLRPATRPITLRHLLTHTSGFAEETWHADIKRYAEVRGDAGGVTGTLAFLNKPLLFEPGERWQYGSSLDWTARVVEAVSGARFDRYLRRHIFEPVGMPDSGYVPAPGQEARLAGVHARRADGRLERIERVIPAEREYYPGSGALLSTADDYVRFLFMLLNEGRAGDHQVLRPETVRLMMQNHTGDLHVGQLVSAVKETSNDAEFLAGQPKGWGLSFLINLGALPSGRSAGSFSWAGLSNCFFWADPERRLAGVLLAQILPFADPEAMKLAEEYETEIYRLVL